MPPCPKSRRVAHKVGLGRGRRSWKSPTPLWRLQSFCVVNPRVGPEDILRSRKHSPYAQLKRLTNTATCVPIRLVVPGTLIILNVVLTKLSILIDRIDIAERPRCRFPNQERCPLEQARPEPVTSYSSGEHDGNKNSWRDLILAAGKEHPAANN